MTEAPLHGQTDLAGFRAEVGLLLAQQVPPEAVHWQPQAPNEDFFVDPAPPERMRPAHKAATAIVPASFLRLVEMVLLHSDPARFDLLYRLLWRLVHEPGLRHDPVDSEMQHAQQMGQSVRRDLQKMKNLLKFHTVSAADGTPIMLAWHEPAHHIVESLGPWFARRYPGARWAILTPQRCIECNGQQIHVAHGLDPASAPREDSPPQAWVAAYRAAFGSHAIALPPAP